jgi:hypothetical protein
MDLVLVAVLLLGLLFRRDLNDLSLVHQLMVKAERLLVLLELRLYSRCRGHDCEELSILKQNEVTGSRSSQVEARGCWSSLPRDTQSPARWML